MYPETYSRAEEGLSFCSYRETRTTFSYPEIVFQKNIQKSMKQNYLQVPSQIHSSKIKTIFTTEK